jgi:hypothetical protein
MQKRILSEFREVYSYKHDIKFFIPEIIGWEFDYEFRNQSYYSVDKIIVPRQCGFNGDRLKITKNVPHDGQSMALLRLGDVVEFCDVKDNLVIVYKDGEFFRVKRKDFEPLTSYSKKTFDDRLNMILEPYKNPDFEVLRELKFKQFMRISV